MCKRHPDYKAIRLPRTNCDDCWAMWMDKHPGWKKVARTLTKQNRPKRKCCGD